MWKTILRNKGFWAGLVLSCLGLYVALSGVQLDKLRSELASVPWAVAFALGVISFFATILRSYRWQVGIESFSKVSFKNVMSAFLAGMFGLNVIPARLGEYFRVFVLGKNSSLSQSSILATVVFERIMDGLTILVIFAGAVLLRHSADTRNILGPVRREFLLLIPLIFAACLGFLFAVSRHPKPTADFVARFSRHLGKFGARLPGMVERFSGGLVIFSDAGRMIQYVAWSFASWFAIGFYYYMNFHMVGIGLGFADAMVVMSVIVVGVMIPAAPGFVGTYHAFCARALVAFGVDPARAFTYAVVTHAVQYILHTLVGFICVMRENVRLADLNH